MQMIGTQVPPLKEGDVLTRDEFLRRWEAMPHVKRAELIRGVVHIPSPVSQDHGFGESDVSHWLTTYRVATPGTDSMSNATWLMLEDSPQPDTSLFILPEFGGISRAEGRYAAGAPEFVAEVCLSSTAHDLRDKLELYQEAGVREYLAVLVEDAEVRWHQLGSGGFAVVPLPADGIYRSQVFPGLWLDAAALLARNLVRVIAVVNEGLASPAHAEFVAQLAARRRA